MYVYMMLTPLLYVYYCNIIADFSQLHMDVYADHTYMVIIVYIVTYFSEPHMDVYAISLIYDYHCYIITDFCQLIYTYGSPYQ